MRVAVLCLLAALTSCSGKVAGGGSGGSGGQGQETSCDVLNSHPEICGNGRDDDCNGKTDCEDEACLSPVFFSVVEDSSNPLFFPTRVLALPDGRVAVVTLFPPEEDQPAGVFRLRSYDPRTGSQAALDLGPQTAEAGGNIDLVVDSKGLLVLDTPMTTGVTVGLRQLSGTELGPSLATMPVPALEGFAIGSMMAGAFSGAEGFWLAAASLGRGTNLELARYSHEGLLLTPWVSFAAGRSPSLQALVASSSGAILVWNSDGDGVGERAVALDGTFPGQPHDLGDPLDVRGVAASDGGALLFSDGGDHAGKLAGLVVRPDGSFDRWQDLITDNDPVMQAVTRVSSGTAIVYSHGALPTSVGVLVVDDSLRTVQDVRLGLQERLPTLQGLVDASPGHQLLFYEGTPVERFVDIDCR